MGTTASGYASTAMGLQSEAKDFASMSTLVNCYGMANNCNGNSSIAMG